MSEASSNAANAAAAAVAASVEQVELGTQAAIDAANARAERAEAATAALVDAAIQQQFREQIDSIRSEISTWRSEVDRLANQLTQCQASMEEMRTTLSQAQTVQVVETQTQLLPDPTNPAQLIPQASNSTTTEVTTVNPASADGQKAVQEAPAPQRKAPRLI